MLRVSSTFSSLKNLSGRRFQLTSTLQRLSTPKILSIPRFHSSSSAEKPKKEPPSAQNPRPLIIQYLSLIKARLAALVLSTTAAGYLLGPCPIDLAVFGWTCLGTFLTIGSANSINQYIEVDNDTQMNRTSNRPLPTGEMTLNHALAFGITTGVVGSSILAVMVNNYAAVLAFGNILLYTMAYTPLKQIHWTNTWVGSVVGAIPPLIGWVANAGELSIGAWCLAYALFIWQIPHFLALSVPLQHDYGRAGYKMLVNKSVDKVATLTLRYSCYLFLLAPVAVYGDFMTPYFLVDCTLLNAWLTYKSYIFWKTKTNTDARKAFMVTLYYLPLLLLLMLLHKKEQKTETDDNSEQLEELEGEAVA